MDKGAAVRRTTRKQRNGEARNRLYGLGVLFLYVYVATGLPIPFFGDTSPTTQRFPCEDNRCGCPGSEQCWTQCRCNGLSENLSWARRKGVRPPTFVLEEARRKGLNMSPWCDGPKLLAHPLDELSSSSCSKIAHCDSRTSTQCNSCSKQTRCPTDDLETTYAGKSVVMWCALGCRGLKNRWLAMGCVVLPPPTVACLTPPLSTDRIPAFSNCWDAFATPPEPPPPKTLASLV